MEKSKSNKPAAYRYHLEQQVVGQLFFQSVTEVNQYKTRFLGVRAVCILFCLLWQVSLLFYTSRSMLLQAVNDELSNTDQQEERFTWFHVVESELYNVRRAKLLQCLLLLTAVFLALFGSTCHAMCFKFT